MAKVLTGHTDRFQGSSYDHLRKLRDGGQRQPMDFQAAPGDEAVPESAQIICTLFKTERAYIHLSASLSHLPGSQDVLQKKEEEILRVSIQYKLPRRQ